MSQVTRVTTTYSIDFLVEKCTYQLYNQGKDVYITIRVHIMGNFPRLPSIARKSLTFAFFTLTSSLSVTTSYPALSFCKSQFLCTFLYLKLFLLYSRYKRHCRHTASPAKTPQLARMPFMMVDTFQESKFQINTV